jgi:hypothetical protein
LFLLVSALGSLHLMLSMLVNGLMFILRFHIQRWYLSFGSQNVARVQLVLYLITLFKTILQLPFWLFKLLPKVSFMFAEADYLWSCTM